MMKVIVDIKEIDYGQAVEKLSQEQGIKVILDDVHVE